MVVGGMFGDFIQLLVGLGLADVLLPFILIFTIVFAVLEKSKIIGEGKKNINVMIALVIALLVIIPHIMGTYQGYDVVNAINTAIPKVSFWIVLIIMGLLLTATFGAKMETEKAGWVPWVAFGIVLLVFGNAAGWFHFEWLSNIDPHVTALIIITAVFIGIIAFVSSGDESAGDIAENIGKNLMKKE